MNHVEKQIQKIINKYSKILLLDKHTWKIKKGCTYKNSLAECVFNYPYLNATINYSEQLSKEKDITRYILHEMCHVITDPLYDKACSRHATSDEIEKEREQLTDHICHIILKNFKK